MTASYPALLIGQMGVDKNYRGRKIGDAICKHCIGLARKFNERVACACITLQTTEDKASYYQQYFFETTRKLRNGQVAMYLSTKNLKICLINNKSSTPNDLMKNLLC
jgi:GNAT superfamily N-acetyltransferase